MTDQTISAGMQPASQSGTRMRKRSMIFMILASVIVLAVELAVVWETVLGAKWIVGLWS